MAPNKSNIYAIGDLLGYGDLQWAMLLGAGAGLVYALGEGGIIPAWGNGQRLPAIGRLMLAAALAGLLAMGADTGQGALLLGLCGIGAAKMAELVTASAISIRRGL